MCPRRCHSFALQGKGRSVVGRCPTRDLILTVMNRWIVFFALAIGSLWWSCRENRPAGKVEVNYRVIRYTESAGSIELGWEPIKGEQPIAYVPSHRRWRAEMPDWARDRREEIMAEIKRETAYMNFRWQEYD